MKAITYIGTDKKAIALSEFEDFPRFIRFGYVGLEYYNGFQNIGLKCKLFHGYLSSIKSKLNDSDIICFDCGINQKDVTQFSNYSTIFEQIRRIVSICDTSRGYCFSFRHSPFNFSDSDAFGNLITSILEMPEIARSSFVSIRGNQRNFDNFANTQLPVETISNWLNRERHAMDQNQRQRYLELPYIHYATFQGTCDLLKQVAFNLQIFNLLSFSIQ